MANALEATTSLVDLPSASDTHFTTVPVVVTTTGAVYSVEEGDGSDPSVV
jgi:hypothetical protein